MRKLYTKENEGVETNNEEGREVIRLAIESSSPQNYERKGYDTWIHSLDYQSLQSRLEDAEKRLKETEFKLSLNKDQETINLTVDSLLLALEAMKIFDKQLDREYSSQAHRDFKERLRRCKQMFPLTSTDK